MKDLRNYPYKRIDTLEMQKYLCINDYEKFAEVVAQLEGRNVLSPVKSSKLNGKRPPLYNKYNILTEQKDYSQYVDELKHMLNFRLNSDYYLKHLEQYEEDRPFVRGQRGRLITILLLYTN